MPGIQPIEFIHPNFTRGRVRYALFDFDGTLSLIREGWQGVMADLMIETLRPTPRCEPLPELRRHVEEIILRTTGVQTIFQMMRLAEEASQRGGNALAPQEYKNVFVQRLVAHIAGRMAALRTGHVQPDELMVTGAADFLLRLRARGVTCYLASGTDQAFVEEEAAALGIAGYFAGIYGARDDYANHSKKMVIARILKENHLEGPELVSFGDGFVEIEDTHAAGGVTVGVASNERERASIDPWKRQRLIEAGADLIVADFACAGALEACLFGTEVA